MHKSYLNLLLVFFLFWSGCQDDDDDITASHYSPQLIGKWEYLNLDGRDQYLKYLIIDPDNYFYFLYNFDNYQHEIYDGVYSVTGNQVYMNQRGLFLFSIKDDTLKLNSPDYNMTFVRNNSAPDETEWLISVAIEKEVQLPDSIRFYDITFDGSGFWGSGGSDIIIKVDTLGNFVTSLPLMNSGGVTYIAGALWVSYNDTLMKVNPLSGEILLKHKIQGTPELFWLAYENGFIWGRSYEGYYLKIEEETGIVVDSLNILLNSRGIEFYNSLLWITDERKIYSVETDSGNIVNTYRLPDDSGYSSGIAHDGTTFWRVVYRYDRVNYSLQKLNIPPER